MTETPPEEDSTPLPHAPGKKGIPPGDHRHGTGNGYINLGCRCDECREAYADWMREARARRASRPIPDHVHGTENGYCNYSCRCEQCVQEHRAVRSRERQIQAFIKKQNRKENPKEPEYVRIQRELIEKQGVQ